MTKYEETQREIQEQATNVMTMKVKLPGVIRQVDNNTVELTVDTSQESNIVTDDFKKRLLERDFSRFEIDTLIEELHDHAFKWQIKQRIKVSHLMD